MFIFGNQHLLLDLLKFMKKSNKREKEMNLVRSFYAPIFYVLTTAWIRYLTFGIYTPQSLTQVPVYDAGVIFIYMKAVQILFSIHLMFMNALQLQSLFFQWNQFYGVIYKQRRTEFEEQEERITELNFKFYLVAFLFIFAQMVVLWKVYFVNYLNIFSCLYVMYIMVYLPWKMKQKFKETKGEGNAVNSIVSIILLVLLTLSLVASLFSLEFV